MIAIFIKKYNNKFLPSYWIASFLKLENLNLRHELLLEIFKVQ